MSKLSLFSSWACYVLLKIVISNADTGVHNKVVLETEADLDPGCCSAAKFDFNANGVVKPKRMAFIIGAQKSGTTFLFDELVKRHPFIRERSRSERKHVATSKLNLKEPRYFHLQPLPDFKEYIENFAEAVDLLNSSLTFIDGTPDYVHVPAAACRIKTAFPDAKILVLLRDPVDRALSHWNMRMITTKKGEAFDVMVRHELRGLTEAGCAYNTAPLDGVLLPRSRLRPLLGASAQRARRRRPLGTHSIPNNDQGRFLRNANMVEASKVQDELMEDSNSFVRLVRSRRENLSLPSWNQCFKCVFFQCSMAEEQKRRARVRAWALLTQIMMLAATKCWVKSEGVKGAAGPICQRPSSPYSLVQRGLYVYQLEWWLRLFKPEQLLILNHEEMKAWPERVLDRAISFLDQDVSLKRRPQQQEATAADNRSIASLLGLSRTKVRKAGAAKNKESGWSLPLKDEDAPETYSEVLTALRSYYKPVNEELYRLMEAMGPSSGWTGKFPDPKT